ncbi:hypothetical protein ACHHYP_20061 [Achlya hypogyna]|uniref:Uncharacterized protein n=1 Tax=Achlya hypogyna TaxID=1202772 RepID=A0A1V9Z988_ACHHY|nr:hypothetical protein ACHHYP_20061 [Achlya hypogyna]
MTISFAMLLIAAKRKYREGLVHSVHLACLGLRRRAALIILAAWRFARSHSDRRDSGKTTSAFYNYDFCFCRTSINAYGDFSTRPVGANIGVSSLPPPKPACNKRIE